MPRPRLPAPWTLVSAARGGRAGAVAATVRAGSAGLEAAEPAEEESDEGAAAVQVGVVAWCECARKPIAPLPLASSATRTASITRTLASDWSVACIGSPRRLT